MTETLASLLLRLSEGGATAELSGRGAKRLFGPEFDRLLARRVLVEQAPLRTWSPCATCECGIGGRLLQGVGSGLVAACPLSAANDVLLDQDDVRVFHVDRANMVQEIARASGFAGSTTVIFPDVWHLTTLPSGEAVILILNETVAFDPLLVSALRARVRGLRNLVLLPSRVPDELPGLLDAAGYRVTTATSLFKSDGAIDIGLLNDETPSHARLVIARSSRMVTLDGKVVRLPDQPFRLLLHLAEVARERGGHVESRQLEQVLWQGLRMPDSRDLRDIIRDIRTPLRALDSKVDLSRLIDTRRSPTRYRLLLEGEEISLLP